MKHTYLNMFGGFAIALIAAPSAAEDSNENILLRSITGQENILEIVQNGTENTLSVTLSGNSLGGLTDGRWLSAEFEALSPLSSGTVTQKGTLNDAILNVSGTSNLFAMTQSGTRNVASLSVLGSLNQAAIYQSGVGNLASVSQTGSRNSVALSQTSW